MFERLGEIEQNGERFKSEAEEPPVIHFVIPNRINKKYHNTMRHPQTN